MESLQGSLTTLTSFFRVTFTQLCASKYYIFFILLMKTGPTEWRLCKEYSNIMVVLGVL